MHVRVSTRRRGHNTYRSVQIVQSYRRPDGMPAHQVLASFGNLSELETENLKLAIKASKNGQSVVLSNRNARPLAIKVQRNLTYLDAASCLSAWDDWELSELIDELATSTKREVSVGNVVAALTVQRCVAPASKLEASRWYPMTALPELQGVKPSQFNNTRIHRVLEMLESIETPLQQRLARRIDSKLGQFVSLFLDCTDTWFVGRGPELAHMHRTKEGVKRRRIGIALMCDRRGFPLRWATVAGNHHEADTMLTMIDQVADLSWADKLPVVVDRAMGRGVTIEALLAREVRFVTAVPAPEICSYSSRIPLGAFDNVELGSAKRDDEHVVKALGQAAIARGFRKARHRYVLDLGVIAKGEGGTEATSSWLVPSRAVAALRMASSIREHVDAGMTIAQLAARYDQNEHSLRRCLLLLGLATELQQRVAQGEADRLTPLALREIASLPAAQQPDAFTRACQAAADDPPLRATRKLAAFCNVPPLEVRVIAIFLPDKFIEQRQDAAQMVRDLEQLVEQINSGLRSSRNQRTHEQILGKLGYALRVRNMTDVFQGVIEPIELNGQSVPQLRLQRNEAAWQRRRCTDGFFLIVAHPQLSGTGEDILELYFAKDQVEKDFQAIKSVLALRPVNHQTDTKVRAHVTVCMLALLIERSIEHRLREAGLNMTAPAALHLLKSAHLNLYATDAPLYSATQPDADQRRILAALKLEHLSDDSLLVATLTPR